MSNKITTFLWVLANGLISIGLTYMLEIDYIYAPLLVPMISFATKEANKFFNPNYPKYGKK